MIIEDPVSVEGIGEELAGLARDLAPEAVVSWDDTADVLLAHVVARRLDVGRLTIVADLGRLSVVGTGRPSRVVLVAAAFDREHAVEPAVALLARQGAQVVAVCSADAGVVTP
ncbi:hypothetical protein [Herbidospora sp. RD11066]